MAFLCWKYSRVSALYQSSNASHWPLRGSMQGMPPQVNQVMWCHWIGPRFPTPTSPVTSVSSLSMAFFCIFKQNPAWILRPSSNVTFQSRLTYGTRDGRKPMHGQVPCSCFYCFCSSLKCLFSESIPLVPLCLIWQVGLHFINEIMTTYCIIWYIGIMWFWRNGAQ